MLNVRHQQTRKLTAVDEQNELNDYEDLNKKIHEFTSNNIYYGLIFLLSLIVMVIAPMFGSVAGFKFTFPDTPEGWVVFVISKLAVACLNVLLFHCFIRQAKKNVRNDPHFLEAQEIMGKISNKIKKPRSPGTYFREIYTKKSTTVFLTTILSTVALTDILTKYDWKLAVSYGATILTCIIFGILKMKDVEIYWTEEYYSYALDQLEILRVAQEVPKEANVIKDESNIQNNKKVPESGKFQHSAQHRR